MERPRQHVIEEESEGGVMGSGQANLLKEENRDTSQ